MKIKVFAAGVLAAPLTTGACLAAEAAQKLAPGDETFAKKAAIGGMAEVKLGELAKDRGSTQEIKDFGNMMVTNHSKATDELKGIASAKGIELPTDLDAKTKSVYDSLSKLSGAAFDKAYIRDMVKDHKEDVSEFDRASKSVADPELKSFAEKTLPVIKAHLDHAEQLSKPAKESK